MRDDYDRLRRTMADLAEHGGGADLYERTLTTSRRMTRRRNALAGGAVAVAVLGLGVPVALAGGDRDALPPPTAATPTAATPTASPAPPSPTARFSSVPPTSDPPSSPATSKGAGKAPAKGCPAGAATLGRAAGLTDGWRIDASSIRCVEGWADARLTAPTEEQQGDGVILFHYTGGRWKQVVEGSAIECATHGVPERIGRRLSSCYYD